MFPIVSCKLNVEQNSLIFTFHENLSLWKVQKENIAKVTISLTLFVPLDPAELIGYKSDEQIKVVGCLNLTPFPQTKKIESVPVYLPENVQWSLFP